MEDSIIYCCCEVVYMPQGGRDQEVGGGGTRCLNSILGTPQKGGGGRGRGDSHLAMGYYTNRAEERERGRVFY